jgi:hypothetical protein
VLNVACRVKKFCTLPKGCGSVKLLLTEYVFAERENLKKNYDFAAIAMAKLFLVFMTVTY